MTIGTRAAVMNDGTIQQVDPPQALYDYPANRFVAEFIGSPAMNLLPVAVERTDGGSQAVHDGFRVDLPAGDGLDALVGGSAVFGVRPEDISLAANLPAGADTCEMTVAVTEPLGEALLMHCEVGGEEVQVKAEPRSDVSPGDAIEVGFDAERLHLFDAATGEAVYHSSPREAVPSEPPRAEK